MEKADKTGPEAGFTLVELVVVVLILGIITAIAIPTFLSLTSSSRSKSAESNVSTTIADEAIYFNQNSSYGTSVSSPSMNVADGGLNWQSCGNPCAGASSAGGKTVYVSALLDASNYSSVIVGDAGSSGTYYWEMLTQNPTVASPSYEVTSTGALPAIATFEGTPTYRTWAQAGG